MLGKRSALKIPISLMALICLSAAASGASQASSPVKGLYLGTFNVLQAWDDFGLLSAEEPVAKASKNLPVMQIIDVAGKLLDTAQWDGTEPKVSADGREWTINLSATIGFRKHSFELKSSWTDKTKLDAGLTKLTITTLGEPVDAAKYSYVLRFPGSGSWASKDGKAAVVASIDGSTEKVFKHVALAPVDSSCTFKSKQIEKADSKKQQRKLFFIEATSNVPKTGDTLKAQIMGVYLTVVKSWSYEPVMDLASVMTSGKADPDVRIFGTADKQAASPGESLEYTYYLINVGMDEATDLNVTIPISEKTGLIAASINGSPGTAKLMPSGEEVEVILFISDSKAADRGIQSFQWRPKNNLMPGETIYISFSVII